MNSYYAAAARAGICVVYDAEVVSLDIHEGAFRSASVRVEGHTEEVTAAAVVIAAGGFEANIDWLREIWGEAADNFIIRGTPLQQGNAAEAAARCGRAGGGGSVAMSCDRR